MLPLSAIDGEVMLLLAFAISTACLYADDKQAVLFFGQK